MIATCIVQLHVIPAFDRQFRSLLIESVRSLPRAISGNKLMLTTWKMCAS